TLVYYGDAFSWHLPRERILAVGMTEGAPGLERVAVRWSPARESARVFTFVSREAPDLRGARRATHTLHNQLQTWLQAPSSGQALPPPVLGLPPTDTAGALAADYMPSGSCVATIAVGVVSVLATWQVISPLIRAGKYHHAILWAGAILVLGAAAVNALLRVLQWADQADQAAGP
ncbi:MAG TPA: hypothetical protein VM283_09925, partial [Armatimonadota bacterium]|nr:hypothetical protein [Armatimonadota bacterium]